MKKLRAAAQLCVAACVAAVSSFAYFINALGFLKPHPALSDTGCVRLLGPIGAEDGAFLPDLGAVILSEVDTLGIDIARPTLGGASAVAVNGSLWLLDRVESPEPRLVRLEVPLPTGVDRRPHGLGLHGDTLFVVNHAYGRGGERVDRFRVERAAGGGSGGLPLRLVHLGAVLGHDGDEKGRDAWTFTERLQGAINDVAPVGEHEFFFTTYHEGPVTLDDRPDITTSDLLKWVMVPWTRKCRIYHCRCAEPDPSGGCGRTACSPVGPAAGMWNGISVSPDKRLLYVADSFLRQIVEFRIVKRDGGAVSLEWQRALKVELPGTLDNVDATSGTLWAGMTSWAIAEAIPPLKQQLEAQQEAVAAGKAEARRFHTFIERLRPDAPPKNPIPGFAVRLDPGTGEAVPVVTTNLLWQVSFSGMLGGKVVLGSAVDEGVLVCPPPKS